MKHPERVEDYLEHIAEAIQRATSYVQPLPDHHAFGQNRQVQDAVVRNIEINGGDYDLPKLLDRHLILHPEMTRGNGATKTLAVEDVQHPGQRPTNP